MESWVLYALSALLLFGVANFLMKFVAGKMPIALISVIYFSAALAALVFIFALKRPAISFPSNAVALTILAGILMGAGIFFALSSLSLGQGTKAVTVFNMNTLVTVALLVLILGEKLSPKTALGIGFAVLSLYLLTA